jgi:hypothetical protein
LVCRFARRFSDHFKTVRDHYAVHGGAVQLEDVSPWLSELAETLLAEPTSDESADQD